MKVVINAKFLSQPITGVQRFATEIAKNLKIIAPEIIFVSPKNILHQELARQLETIVVGKHTGILWEQYDLPAFLKSVNYPLLVNLANAAPLQYPKQIVTIHDIGFKINPKWYSLPFRKYYNFLIPRIARNSLSIITVSNSSKAEIHQYLGVPVSKINVIYNAVSPNFTLPAPSKKKQSYLLAVSSLDPRKNFLNLIKAFNQIETNSYELRIVGTQNKVFADSQLKRLIRINSNIVLTGYVSDQELTTLYQQATAFIYPSIYEGFGIPPLEAMACGCPTIVSKISSMPEIFQDACHYINPFDLDSISSGIQLVLQDQVYRKNLILKGSKLLSQYSWQKSAFKLMEVIAAHS